MVNPVVVFVLKERCSGANSEFPIGWTETGERLNGATKINGNDCCVILLEDDQNIPACDHGNKKKDQPLPVITHASSKLYTAATIAGSALSTWGTPVPRDCFSHDTKATDGIFKEIEELLRNPSGAKAFAEKRWLANDLDMLDQLAAICQIVMIDPRASSDVEPTWYSLLNKLLGDEFRSLLFTSWEESDQSKALGLIAIRANELSQQLHG